MPDNPIDYIERHWSLPNGEEVILRQQANSTKDIDAEICLPDTVCGRDLSVLIDILRDASEFTEYAWELHRGLGSLAQK